MNAIPKEMNEWVDRGKEMKGRVKPRTFQVRIVLTIIGNVKQWVRVTTLERAKLNEVHERIEAFHCDFRIPL